MKCPYCNHVDSKVLDSRALEDFSAIKRRRACESCGERFTTFERIDTIPIAVIKKDNTRETFDRSKILNGVIKSCNKRPVTMTQMERLVNDIEANILNTMSREVPSELLGEMVMDELKNLDQVAYVRFASVYRQFKDIDTFMSELSKLLKEDQKNNEE